MTRSFALRFTLATLVGLLALEAGLRLWDATHESSPGLGALSANRRQSTYIQHPYVGYRLNPRARKRSLSSFGTRGPEFPLRKPEREFRILCVGGSTTYGSEVPAHASYPAQLGQELRRDSTASRHYRVVNCGVPGYTTIETLVNFELRLLELDPDVLLVYHGINDARFIQGRGYASDYTHVRRAFRDPSLHVAPYQRWLIDHVRIYAWLSKSLGVGVEGLRLENLAFVEDQFHVLKPPVPEVNHDGVSAYLRNLRTLVAVARAHGVEPCLTTFAMAPSLHPDPGSLVDCVAALNAGTRALAAELSVPLFEVAERLDGKDELFVDFVHRNAQGCGLHARAVAEAARTTPLWGLQN